MANSLEEMYLRVYRALEHAHYASRETPVFTKALEWIKSFPPQLDNALRVRLMAATQRSFSLSEAELVAALDGTATNGFYAVKVEPSSEEKLREMLPKGGWFEWYDKYTLETESPLSYHVFSSLCILGAALGRRVYRRMGHFSIYPNYCSILVGPTGRVKKTTAGQIAADIVKRGVLCPILADKVTPERMITVLKESGHHFIFAPEMAVFFGKQRYNEGLVTNILRILDSPAEFIAETQAREQEILHDLAVSFLGCSTPSLLGSSMPEEVTSSGFMNRFMLVSETDTERCFPTPGDPPRDVEERLIKTVLRLKAMSGEMVFDKEAGEWYDHWYRERRTQMRQLADDTLVEVLERAPVHLVRTAMLMHLVQCDHFAICLTCARAAESLIKYTERGAPRVVQKLKQTAVANDMDAVVLTLERLGGAADRSTLVRRLSGKMDAARLTGHIRTLEEGGRVKVSKRGGATYYMLSGEGLDETN